MRLATVLDNDSHEPRAVFELPSGHRIDLFLSLHNSNSDYLQGPLTLAGPGYRRLVERIRASLLEKTWLDLKAPRDWPRGEIARGRMDACEGLYHDRAIPTLLLEQCGLSTEETAAIRALFA